MNLNKQPAKSPWILCQSKSNPGKFYYFNVVTGVQAWCEDYDKVKAKPPNRFRSASYTPLSYRFPPTGAKAATGTKMSSQQSNLQSKTYAPTGDPPKSKHTVSGGGKTQSDCYQAPQDNFRMVPNEVSTPNFDRRGPVMSTNRYASPNDIPDVAPSPREPPSAQRPALFPMRYDGNTKVPYEASNSRKPPVVNPCYYNNNVEPSAKYWQENPRHAVEGTSPDEASAYEESYGTPPLSFGPAVPNRADAESTTAKQNGGHSGTEKQPEETFENLPAFQRALRKLEELILYLPKNVKDNTVWVPMTIPAPCADSSPETARTRYTEQNENTYPSSKQSKEYESQKEAPFDPKPLASNDNATAKTKKVRFNSECSVYTIYSNSDSSKKESSPDEPAPSSTKLGNNDLRYVLMKKRRCSNGSNNGQDAPDSSLGAGNYYSSATNQGEDLYETREKLYDEDDVEYDEVCDSTEDKQTHLQTDLCYVAVDVEALLENFAEIEEFILSDKHCRLLVTRNLQLVIMAVALGEIGPDAVAARKVVDRLMVPLPPHCVYLDNDSNENILTCCTRLTSMGYKVILVSNDEDFYKNRSYILTKYKLQCLRPHDLDTHATSTTEVGITKRNGRKNTPLKHEEKSGNGDRAPDSRDCQVNSNNVASSSDASVETSLELEATNAVNTADQNREPPVVQTPKIRSKFEDEQPPGGSNGAKQPPAESNGAKQLPGESSGAKQPPEGSSGSKQPPEGSSGAKQPPGGSGEAKQPPEGSSGAKQADKPIGDAFAKKMPEYFQRINEGFFSAKIKRRLEEYMCCFTQILEDTFTHLLTVNRIYHCNYPPRRLLVELIAGVQFMPPLNKPDDRFICDIFTRLYLRHSDDDGLLNPSMLLPDFLELFSHGLLLVQKLRESSPYNLILADGEQSLLDLQNDIAFHHRRRLRIRKMARRQPRSTDDGQDELTDKDDKEQWSIVMNYMNNNLKSGSEAEKSQAGDKNEGNAPKEGEAGQAASKADGPGTPYGFLQTFLTKLSGTLKMVHTFVVRNGSNIQKGLLSEAQRKSLLETAQKFQQHLTNVISNIESIRIRDSSDDSVLKTAIPEQGAMGESKMMRYRHAVATALEQTQKLNRCLNVIISHLRKKL